MTSPEFSDSGGEISNDPFIAYGRELFAKLSKIRGPEKKLQFLDEQRDIIPDVEGNDPNSPLYSRQKSLIDSFKLIIGGFER